MRVALAADGHRDRRIVSVVFADIVGSVALGRRLDPEAFTSLIGRVFDVMAGAVEDHGGRVDKFAGDAVLAIFGAPVLHEDDAVRAVRAAADMRTRLAEVNVEILEIYGESIALRMGVNTGEATVRPGAAGQQTVLGDAINLAARLEQAAPPGEIYIAEATRLLLGDRVRLEALDPLQIKGSERPVIAHRLLGIADQPVVRPLGPLVGRSAELATLVTWQERGVAGRTCAVLAVAGEAGIGKTRLVAEVEQRLGGTARVIRGHCLPYGRGLGFWPLRELIIDLLSALPGGGVRSVRSGLAALLGEAEAASIVDGIEGLVGAEGATSGRHEIAWATRRVLLEAAGRTPLVVVIDDLQWAEPALLEVLEYIAKSVADAPLLIIAIGRTEMLEMHRPWLDRVARQVLQLSALDHTEALDLLRAVVGGAGVGSSDADAERIVSAGGGNPLFLEELARAAHENAEDAGPRHQPALQLPPTVHALLATRVAHLSPRLREALTRASVIGETFTESQLSALSPSSSPHLAGVLIDLEERQFVVRDRADTLSWRFHHLLGRDAAYASLLKEDRAALHERFATWIEGTEAAASIEHVAIVGHHLEQAHRFWCELRPADRGLRRLADRASSVLENAGRLAMVREDLAGAHGLLQRARALVPHGQACRPSLLLDLFTSAGERGVDETYLQEAIDVGMRDGDELTAAQASIALLRGRVMREGTPARAREALAALPALIETLRFHEDERGLSRACELLANANGVLGHIAADAEAMQQAFDHAVRADDQLLIRHAVGGLATILCFVPTHIDRALGQLGELLAASRERSPRAVVLGATALLLARRGDAVQARACLDESAAIAADLARPIVSGFLSLEFGAWTERLLGNLVAAEEHFHTAVRVAGDNGMSGWWESAQGRLAYLLCELGRHDDAHAVVSAVNDNLTDDRLCAARAMIMARRGSVASARQSAHDAAHKASSSDEVVTRADTLVALADVMSVDGDIEAARATLGEALELQTARGATAEARLISGALAGLKRGGVALLHQAPPPHQEAEQG